MFVQRYDYPSESHRYYWNKPYIQKVYTWGNCTTWCYARSAEAISVHIQKDTTTINQSGYVPTTDKPIFATDRDFNACNWYANTLWPKGQTPKVASIVVHGAGTWSSLGHVMFVEQVNSDGTIVVTEGGRTSAGGGQGQYGFKRRTVNPSTACGDCPLIGYIYNPYFEKQLEPVARNSEVDQVKVSIENLRVREHAGLDQQILYYCPTGYYNVNKIKENIDGFTWYEIDPEINAYIAQVSGVTYLPKQEEKISKLVLDLSEWQDEIDYSKVVCDGVILRVGFTGSETLAQKLDKQFKNHYLGFNTRNIPIGAYFYSNANSVEMAQKEAAFVLENIKGLNIQLPIWFDSESAIQRALGAVELRKVADAFCEVIEKAGYTTGIYASLNWLNNTIDMSDWKYETWVAQYYSQCNYTGDYGMWQFTSSGSVDGIVGNVDMNYLYKTYYNNVPVDNNTSNNEDVSIDIVLLEKEIKDQNEKINSLEQTISKLNVKLDAIKRIIELELD